MASAYMHLSIYEDVDRAIAALPGENAHVRNLLVDALDHLKRADQSVFQKALESSELASQQLVAGPGNDAFSFLTGGQNYFAQAIQAFTGFGRFGQRLGR